MKKPNSPHSKTKQHKWYINKSYRDIHGLFIEAICPHGIGHHKGIHGCDGCCTTAPKDIWNQVTSDENSPHSKKKCKCCEFEKVRGIEPPLFHYHDTPPQKPIRQAQGKQESGGWKEKFRQMYEGANCEGGCISSRMCDVFIRFIKKELQEAERRGMKKVADKITEMMFSYLDDFGTFDFEGFGKCVDNYIQDIKKLLKK